MRRALSASFVVALLAADLVTLGCAAAPRTRPVQGGDVDTSAGSVEADRRRLTGTWTLATYDIVNANGTTTRVQAQARLKYDEFGNLEVTGRLQQPGATPTAQGQILDYSGRAVLDPTSHQLRLVDATGSALQDGPVADLVNVRAVRKYAFEGNQLRIELADASGRTTAIAIWNRES